MGELIITNYKYLKSLEGCPKVVNRWAQIYDNPKLKSIENFPEKIDGDFLWTKNDIELTEEDIRRVCRVKGEIRLNLSLDIKKGTLYKVPFFIH